MHFYLFLISLMLFSLQSVPSVLLSGRTTSHLCQLGVQTLTKTCFSLGRIQKVYAVVAGSSSSGLATQNKAESFSQKLADC